MLQGGKVWEKAGVGVSVVYGTMPPEAYRAAKGNSHNSKPTSNGVSITTVSMTALSISWHDPTLTVIMDIILWHPYCYQYSLVADKWRCR